MVVEKGAIMAIPDAHWLQRQLNPTKMSTSEFNLTSPFCSQPILNYPAVYDSLLLGYDIIALEGAENDVSGGPHVSPQQIFGHQPLCSEVPPQAVHDLHDQTMPTSKNETDQPETLASHNRSECTEEDQSPDPIQRNRIGTDVDTLMKIIQVQGGRVQQPIHIIQTQKSTSENPNSDSGCTVPVCDRRSSRSGPSARRKYACRVQSCAKTFTQKTHLEIHMRAHTGYKPYV